MTGRSHLFFGIGTGVIAAVAFKPISFVHIPLIGAASLLPDIDSPSSSIGKRFKFIGKIFSHRGFFHTPLFSLLFLLIPDEGIKWSCFIGIWTHLFLDSFNKSGIMFFWPLNKKRYGLADIKYGSRGEVVIIFLLFFIEIILAKLLFPASPNV